MGPAQQDTTVRTEPYRNLDTHLVVRPPKSSAEIAAAFAAERATREVEGKRKEEAAKRKQERYRAGLGFVRN